MNRLELFRTHLSTIGLKGAVKKSVKLYLVERAARSNLAKNFVAIGPDEIRTRRRGSRVFVFGSGYSLNDIQPNQWRHIAANETVGFNAFVRQNWVRTDFHIVRGWGEGAGAEFDWRRACGELANLIDSNPHYRNTTLILQGDPSAEVGNGLLGAGFLCSGRAVHRYRTRRDLDLPTARLEDGLVHGTGTLCDAVNFAAVVGWTEIVLVGVDLYDTRYFFLPPDRTLNTDYRTGEIRVDDVSDRGQRWDQPHQTFSNGAVGLFGRWTEHLAARGARLSVWNPRSLLRAVMPVYQPEESECIAPETPRV